MKIIYLSALLSIISAQLTVRAEAPVDQSKIVVSRSVDLSSDPEAAAAQLSDVFGVQTNGFKFVPDAGRKGGALVPDHKGTVRFKDTFTFFPGAMLKASVDFQYDGSLANPNQDGTVLMLKIKGNSSAEFSIESNIDPAPVTHALRMQLPQSSAPSSGRLITEPLTNSWYRFVAEIEIQKTKFSDAFTLNEKLYKLTEEGEILISVDFPPTTRFDYTFPTMTSFEIEVTGDSYAGCAAIGNLKVDGFTTKPVPPDERIITQSNIRPAAELLWNSRTGKAYYVEWSPQLEKPTWERIGGPFDGKDDKMSTLFTVRQYQSGFFRVVEK